MSTYYNTVLGITSGAYSRVIQINGALTSVSFYSFAADWPSEASLKGDFFIFGRQNSWTVRCQYRAIRPAAAVRRQNFGSFTFKRAEIEAKLVPHGVSL